MVMDYILDPSSIHQYNDNHSFPTVYIIVLKNNNTITWFIFIISGREFLTSGT